jgi:ubiquinone biosynthesis protein UbiJ
VQAQELAELKAQAQEVAELKAQNAALAARLERLEQGAIRTATAATR